jgi:hypothetical protein
MRRNGFSLTIILTIALLVLFSSVSGCSKSRDGTGGMASEEPELLAQISASAVISDYDMPVMADFELISEPSSTEDQMTTAQIIRYAGEDKYTIRLTSEDRLLADIPFESGGQILSIDWQNGDRFLAITSHINPSANQYCVVEPGENYRISYYYGCVFIWNEDFSNLYYIEPAPHFSDETADSLKDKNGNVIYKTQDDNRMTATLAVSPDEEHFAVGILTPEDEQVLVILKKTGDTAAEPVGIIREFSGIVSFIDNETLLLSSGNGEASEIKLNDIPRYSP